MFECQYPPYTLPAPLAAELSSAYGEPHRAYHNVRHIESLLELFDTVAVDVGWSAPADVYTAILFHDAIYDPAAKDNEARSAAWARRAIVETPLFADADGVAGLIELTAKHGKLESADGDAALFLDADMAILGSSPAEYQVYARNVRREYAMVPADAYRTGRGAFLASVLAKPRIYFSDFFHDRYDRQARLNLAWEQNHLASGALD